MSVQLCDSESYGRYAEESKKWIVGPMPVEDFLRKFLPQVDGEMPSAKDAFKKVPSNPSNERELYGPLLEDINTANRCPDIRFFDMSSASVDSGLGSRKPDCCGYHDTGLKNIREKNGKRPVDLGHAELFFEIKVANDPFDDSPHNLRDEDRIKQHSSININTEARKLAKNALGQNVAHAVEVCARQHCAFYFSVFIIKTRARLIRWDRAGAVVSRSFDYKKNPRYLCEFLWRYGLATPEQQGDATRLTAEVKRHYQPGRATKLVIPEGGMIQYDLVSRPVRSPLSMSGRSTRGYFTVKIDPSGKEHLVVFVKDTWCVDVSRIEVEGEIHDDLIEKNQDGDDRGVSETAAPPHINENEAFDNRDGSQVVQCTRTNEFLEATWSCRGERNMKVTKHVHYRLVLSEVGYPFSELSGTRELFEATRDALKALIEAHNKCERLHRDVSVDNVVLVRDRKTGRRRGILIDWELSTMTDRQEKARDYFRSGTWAFMSRAACKGDETFRHSLDDDMESLLYVVLFCCARYIPHGYVENLGRRLGLFFDSYDEDGNVMTGGLAKRLEVYEQPFTAMLELQIDVWIFFASAYRMLSGVSKSQRKWEQADVLKLWDKTCNVGLHDGDRYVHDVGKVLGERTLYHSPRTTAITGELPGCYGSGSRKRSSGGGREASGQSSKRRRGNNGKVDGTVDGGANGKQHGTRSEASQSNISSRRNGRGRSNGGRSGLELQKGRQRNVAMPVSGRDERRSARLAAKASSRSLR